MMTTLAHLDNTTLLLIVAGIVYMIAGQLVTRRYSLTKLWAMPLIVLAYAFTKISPDSLNDAFALLPLLGAAFIGGISGYVRGMVNTVTRDPQTGDLIVYGSFLGLLLWIGTVAVDVVARYILQGGSTMSFSSNAALASLLITIGAAIGARRLAWYIKATGFSLSRAM